VSGRLVRGLALALQAGALVAVGALVAPTLFRVLPERALAGRVAGELFRELTWLVTALSSLAFVLAERAARDGLGTVVGPGGRGRAGWRSSAFWTLAPAALLLANEYALRPVMEAARAPDGGVTAAFMAWHAVSGTLYAAATLAAVLLLAAELRRR
jgi:hypothetical protein